MYDDIQVTLTKTEKFAYFITHSLQIKKVKDFDSFRSISMLYFVLLYLRRKLG